MPKARRLAVGALAGAIASGSLELGPGADPKEAAKGLLGIKGIGPWTANYVAMRGFGNPDVFMPTDLGIPTGGGGSGSPTTPSVLARLAEGWRPWRSYAMAYLWASLSEEVTSAASPASPGSPDITGSSIVRCPAITNLSVTFEITITRSSRMNPSTTIPRPSTVARYRTTFESPVGPAGVEATGVALTNLYLPVQRRRIDAATLGSPEPPPAASRLLDETARQSTSISPASADGSSSRSHRSGPNSSSTFGALWRPSPYGKTMSYGEVAALIKRPKGRVQSARPTARTRSRSSCRAIGCWPSKTGSAVTRGASKSNRQLLALESVTYAE